MNLLHENGTILYALLGLDGWKLDNNTTSVILYILSSTQHTQRQLYYIYSLAHNSMHFQLLQKFWRKVANFHNLFCSGYSHEVTLPPDFTCDRCVLQLVRQAAEWSAAGGYMFWSCADVSIQNRTGTSQSYTCSYNN